MRSKNIERLVPLDDFDLEIAATLREHLRIPGMGETTTRHFRDKLAMRMVAAEANIRVPEFVGVLNDAKVTEFMSRVPAPWVLKPRMMAGAIGIKKVHSAGEFWRIADTLGDQRSFYLLERFVPGDIFHVDSIVYEREIRFAIASGYGAPPLDVSHGGGIFTTRVLERGSEIEQHLLAKNAEVLGALRLVRGVSHSEYIQGGDGEIYFLETSARVGGAHISDLVEAATGLNLWAEWAKIEIAAGKSAYHVSPAREEYAGLIVSLARQEHPDTSAYDDVEIVYRVSKFHHAGFILKSASYERIQTLLDSYSRRFIEDFLATQPVPDKPAH